MLLAVVGAMVFAGAAAHAQAPATAQGAARTVPQSVLEQIVRLDCTFTLAAAGVWPDGEPAVRSSTRSDPLLVRMSDISVADGTATSRSAGRTASVSAKSDRSNLYFLDVGPDGTLALTTVFSQESRPGRLKAVHTRTGPAAEQFYGDCAAVR